MIFEKTIWCGVLRKVALILVYKFPTNFAVNVHYWKKNSEIIVTIFEKFLHLNCVNVEKLRFKNTLLGRGV